MALPRICITFHTKGIQIGVRCGFGGFGGFGTGVGVGAGGIGLGVGMGGFGPGFGGVGAGRGGLGGCFGPGRLLISCSTTVLASLTIFPVYVYQFLFGSGNSRQAELLQCLRGRHGKTSLKHEFSSCYLVKCMIDYIRIITQKAVATPLFIRYSNPLQKYLINCGGR